MTDKTQIDVIIPVFNCEKYIGEAIDSILNQTWKDLSIIVVDDGSTDNTASVVEKITESGKRIVLISPGKVGLSNALNIGIDSSKAPYIAFLDADDVWKPEKLEKQMNYLFNHNNIQMCFTMIQEFESFDDDGITQNFHARDEIMKGVVRGTFLGKKELFDKYGKFKPSINMGEFIDWMSPVINEGVKYIVLDEVLMLRRIHSNNLTRQAKPADYLSLIKAHLTAKKKS